MYWFDVPDILVKKIANTEFFHVKLHRTTKKFNIIYEVKYIMHLNNSPYQINDKKYAMFIKWSNGSNYRLIIGQNPSISKTIKKQSFHVDDTNWNIIKTLKSLNYDGYIMINTFPTIDPKGKSISNIIKSQINIEVFNCIINTLKIQYIDLACTKSNNVALDFINNAIINSKLNYCKFEYGQQTISHFSQQFFNTTLSSNSSNTVKITQTQVSIKFPCSTNNTCKVDF